MAEERTALREQRIAGAMDWWERLSEMPTGLASLVAYTMGMWAYPEEGDPPRRPRRETFVAIFPTRESWQECVEDTITSDRHRTLANGLIAWLTSGYELTEDGAVEVGVPSNERLLRSLPELWPTLDQLPPALAVHFGYALLASAGEAAATAAARRLVPQVPLPEDAFETSEGTVQLLKWLRGIAVGAPVLALKVGLEAMLRHPDGPAPQAAN